MGNERQSRVALNKLMNTRIKQQNKCGNSMNNWEKNI
jgi:hypothetical protein